VTHEAIISGAERGLTKGTAVQIGERVGSGDTEEQKGGGSGETRASEGTQGKGKSMTVSIEREHSEKTKTRIWLHPGGRSSQSGAWAKIKEATRNRTKGGKNERERSLAEHESNKRSGWIETSTERAAIES